MEGCILKVNMINAGLECPTRYSLDEIARANLDVLQRTMPTAIPGVNYLSGGQSLTDALARLSAINAMKTKSHPWNLSFSWSAAIQMPLFAICKEQGGNLDAAIPLMSSLYLEELKMASDAAKGVYTWAGDDGSHYLGKEKAGDE